jgi:hypothetical protein
MVASDHRITRKELPNVRIGTGVIVVGRAPGFNSVSTGLLVAT